MRLNQKIFLFVIYAILLINSAGAYDLSEYPSPFIKDGNFSGTFVVGDKAPAEEVIALSDIIASLQYEVLDTTTGLSYKDTIIENQTKTYEIGSLSYEITLSSADSDSAQFVVNGMTTKVLSHGDYDMLPDGTAITLVDTFFEQNVYSALFYIGDSRVDIRKNNIGTGTAKLASEVTDTESDNLILVGHSCNNPLVFKMRGGNDCTANYEPNTGYIESYESQDGKILLVVTGNSVEDTLKAASFLTRFHFNKQKMRGNRIQIVNNAEKLKAKQKQGRKSGIPLDNNMSKNYYASMLLIFLVLILIISIIAGRYMKINKI